VAGSLSCQFHRFVVRGGSLSTLGEAREDSSSLKEMEETAWNIDRLVTVAPRFSGKLDRWTIPALYDAASREAGGKPVSLVAAQRLIEEVKAGDRVILVDHFAYRPRFPHGETDGPPGVASLARALSFGLKALPVLVTGDRDLAVARLTTQAAGLNVLPYDEALRYDTKMAAVSGEILFPTASDGESRDAAISILDRCAPKAVISVETMGPNRKGVRHSGAGYNAEAEDTLPRLEHLFLEASARGIATIGMIDLGNEIGSGTIEEDVRRITPYANVCRCPCGDGNACTIKTDIVFPASISNWAAYAVSAMLGYLLRKPDALQDDDTERRMLEACAMAGALEGASGRTLVAVDGVGLKGQQGIVNLLHAIVENGLKRP
jgi:D-glutamate cyclase